MTKPVLPQPILNHALDLYERGVTPQRIGEQFPEYAAEINEILAIVGVLMKGKAAATAPKKLLQQIVLNLPIYEKQTPQPVVMPKSTEPVQKTPAWKPSAVRSPWSWQYAVPVGVVALFIVLASFTPLFNIKQNKSDNETTNQPDLLQRFNDSGAPIGERSGTAEPLAETASPETAATAASFDYAGFTAEYSSIAFEPDMETFFSDETAMNEVSPALQNF